MQWCALDGSRASFWHAADKALVEPQSEPAALLRFATRQCAPRFVSYYTLLFECQHLGAGGDLAQRRRAGSETLLPHKDRRRRCRRRNNDQSFTAVWSAPLPCSRAIALAAAYGLYTVGITATDETPYLKAWICGTVTDGNGSTVPQSCGRSCKRRAVADVSIEPTGQGAAGADGRARAREAARSGSGPHLQPQPRPGRAGGAVNPVWR